MKYKGTSKMQRLENFKVNEIDLQVLSRVCGGKHYGGNCAGSAWSADLEGTNGRTGSGTTEVGVGPFKISQTKETFGSDLGGSITYDGLTKHGEWPCGVMMVDNTDIGNFMENDVTFG